MNVHQHASSVNISLLQQSRFHQVCHLAFHCTRHNVNFWFSTRKDI